MRKQSAIESDASPTQQTGAVRFAGIVPYLIFLIHVYSVFALTEDDCYITLRYGANLAAGHGAVYNIGDRVEGFTSFLHMLVDALICRIFGPSDPLFAVKIASVLFGLLTLAATYRLARAARLTHTGAVVAQTVIAASFSFAASSVNGLETTLYTFFLAVALTSLLREVDPDAASERFTSGFLLFIATLARPDAMVLFGFLLVARLISSRHGLPSMGRSLVKWALAYLIPFAGFVLARVAYFGTPLPNTYYAKSNPLLPSIKQGLIYLLGKFPLDRWFDLKTGVVSAFHNAGPIQVITFTLYALTFWLVTISGLREMRRQRHVAFILATVIIGQIAFILRSGGDWMASWRFVVAILPVIAIAQTANLRNLVEGQSEPTPRFAKLACPVYAVALVSIGFFLHHPSWGSIGFTTRGYTMMGTSRWGPLWRQLGDYIDQRMPHGCVVATTEVGYPGYVNRDKTIIDMAGLVDKTISHLKVPHNFAGVNPERWCVPGDPIYNYLEQRRPDYILTFFVTPSTPAHPLGKYDLVDTFDAPAFFHEGVVKFYVYRRNTTDQRGSPER